jgi:hypothetical protein
MHSGMSSLLVVRTESILVSILFLDVELRCRHLGNWYRAVGKSYVTVSRVEYRTARMMDTSR